jgi:hypothetical protein
MVAALNSAANVIEAGVKRCGVMIPSVILGCIGSRIVRGNWALGALQGAVTGGISYGLLHPARNWLDKRTGPGENQVHNNTRWQLWVVGKIAQYAVPTAVVVLYGDKILTVISDNLPKSLGSMIAPDPADAKYNSVARALISNVAPAAIEHIVEWARRANKNK